MPESGTNPYLRTKVMTSSPAELRLMLFDGAIRFLEQAKRGLEEGDNEASYNGISRCQQILMELLGGLRPEEAPDLCQRLSGLYTFMYLELVRACTDRDAATVDSVLGLLRYERETWAMLLDQLHAENGAGASGADQVADALRGASRPAPEPADGLADEAAAAPVGRIVGGRVSMTG